MKYADIRAALEPFARLRLNDMRIGDDLGNGTPLSDAAASLLAAELARQGNKAARRPEDTVSAASEELVRACIGAVRDLLNSGGGRGDTRILPSGTKVEGGYHTGINIGTTSLVPVRGRPGLHGYGEWEAAPGNPGAAALKKAVVAAMGKLPKMDVPHPTLDDISVRSDYRHRDVLSIPMRGGPGVTYQHDEMISPAETLLDIEIALIASTAAEKAKDVWKDREKIDAEYARVMEEIEPVIAKAQAQGLPVRLSGVKLQRGYGRVDVRPQIEVLGNDLKPTTWTPFVGGNSTLAKVVENQMTTQRQRKKVLDQSEERGSRGRIDCVTLAAVRAYADDPEEVLRRMAVSRRLTIREGRAGGTWRGGKPTQKHNPLRLTWRNGRIESSFAFTDSILWQQGTLMVKNTSFPQTVIEQLPGKPLTALLDHPFVSAQDRIRSIRPMKDNSAFVYFNVDTSWTTFDAETGGVAQ